MKQTRPKKLFKERFGQANHFLITSLVGLNFVETEKDIKKPEEFRTSWNPKDVRNSVRRSRHYILNSFLVVAVDSLDMYISLIYKGDNKLHYSKQLEAIYSSAGQSVYNKCIDIGEHYQINPVVMALVDVLITWRNNTTHYFAKNALSTKTCLVLNQNKSVIQENYCGLEVHNLIDKVEKGETFTFKEAASLIKATHHYVEEIDRHVIKNLDICDYTYKTVLSELKNNVTFRKQFFEAKDKRRERFVENYILQEVGKVDLRVIEKCLMISKTDI